MYIESVQLRLQHDNGMDGDKQKYSNKTYSHIKENAADVDLLAVSRTISGLSAKPVLIAKKIETTVLE